MIPPLSVNASTAAPSTSGAQGGLGSFVASPVYRKPWIDLDNPVHLAALAVGALLVVYAVRRRR